MTYVDDCMREGDTLTELEFTVIEKNGSYGAGVVLRDDNGQAAELLSLYYSNSKRPAFIPVNAFVHGLRGCHARGIKSVRVITDIQPFYETVIGGDDVDYELLHFFESSRRYREHIDIDYHYVSNAEQARQLALDALERRKPLYVINNR